MLLNYFDMGQSQSKIPCVPFSFLKVPSIKFSFFYRDCTCYTISVEFLLATSPSSLSIL